MAGAAQSEVLAKPSLDRHGPPLLDQVGPSCSGLRVSLCSPGLWLDICLSGPGAEGYGLGE